MASMSSTRMIRCGTPTVPKDSPGSPSSRLYVRHLDRKLRIRQTDLGGIAGALAPSRYYAGVGQEAQVTWLGQLEVDRQPGGLQSAAFPHMAAREPSEFQ